MYAADGVHGLEHVVGELAEAVVDFGHRLGDGVEAGIGVAENLESGHGTSVRNSATKIAKYVAAAAKRPRQNVRAIATSAFGLIGGASSPARCFIAASWLERAESWDFAVRRLDTPAD
jgi:hypothetical protein